MRFKYVIVILLSIPLALISQETSLQGVVNTYTRVQSIDECSNTMSVSNPSGLQAGTQVVIIQMKGATINNQNNNSFGQINELGSAGLYEINTIASINGSNVVMQRPLLNNYDVNGRLQLVNMPVYENVTTSDTLTCQAWNGQTGGVLALEVSGELRIDAPLDVSGKGFRGGQAVALTSECSGDFLFFPGTNITNYFFSTNNWRGAAKGEGIAEYTVLREWGRGPQANGGGGGNDHNTGGGGGANVSSGGQGGQTNRNSNSECRGENPGLGGVALQQDNIRLFMGGGGGAGHANNSAENVSGGNGGGIIILKANQITRVFGGIYADGRSPGPAQGDGGGGGGAGGTIAIEVNQLDDNTLIHAFGGNGSLVDNNGLERCFGPGGGGSGGQILINQPGMLPDTRFQVTGGQAGRSINSAICSNSSNMAENGSNGQLSIIESLAVNVDSFETPEIESQPVSLNVCEGNDLSIETIVSGDNITLQWQLNRGTGFENIQNNAVFSGSQSPILNISNIAFEQANYTYRLVVTPSCGDALPSTPITVNLTPRPQAEFVATLNDLTVNLMNNSLNVDSYSWSFGDGAFSEIPEPSYTYDSPGIYEITLIGTNACASDTVSLQLTIGNDPVANFSVENTSGCAPLEVAFINQSIGNPTSVEWNFENGNPAASSADNPVVTYNQSGTYQVQLIATNDLGADTLITEITVDITEEPIADFNFTLDGNALFTSNLSENATEQLWDFGDGNTDSSESPLYEYSFPGNYVLFLIATNECGSDTASANLEIIAPPIPDFRIDTLAGCSPFATTFINLTEGDGVSYAWSFQAGTPGFSDEENPRVSYASSGTYEVELTAFNDGGSATITRQITIDALEEPIADFDLDINDLFVGLINNAQNEDELAWQFLQDGQLLEEIRIDTNSYIFDAPGTYEIRQIVSNACGQDTLIQVVEITALPVASFTIGDLEGCFPLPINIVSNSQFATSIEADLEGAETITVNDGNIQAVYIESGTYTWNLIAVNETGRDTLSLEVDIEVQMPPEPEFTTEVDFLTIGFTHQAANAETICYVVGDQRAEAAATDSSFFFTVDEPGIYQVGIVAKSECGQDSVFRTVNVDASPTAQFEVLDTTGCDLVTLRIRNTSLNSEAFTFNWPENFDLFQRDEQTFDITFDSSGTYVFELIAENEFGFDTTSRTINVEVFPPAVVDFTFSGFETDVNFVNRANVIDRATVILWDFGDGSESQEVNPVHSYDEFGEYTVILTISYLCDGEEEQIEISKLVRVNAIPEVEAMVSPQLGCVPVELTLTGSARALIDEYEWTIIGPNVLEVLPARDTQFIITRAGEYEIRLSAINELGEDIAFNNFTFQDVPSARFSQEMDDLNVRFINESIMADSVFWNFGDGRSSSLRSPLHAYADFGEYEVQLIAFNECGTDTVSRVLVVGGAPAANFTTVNANGCAPHLVQFRNRSTGTFNTVRWTFPGGAPAFSEEENPEVVYFEPGIYGATLRLEGPLGNSTITLDSIIEIRAFPKANFDFEIDEFAVTFTNTSTGAEAYRWNFGDGTESTAINPVHTYEKGGVYRVSLNATSGSCGNSTVKNVPVELTNVFNIFESEDIKIYPNPASEAVNIEVGDISLLPLTLFLYNLQGEIIRTEKLNSSRRLNLNELESGLYIIRLTNQKKQWYGKLLKE